jgi:hypothetical protein
MDGRDCVDCLNFNNYKIFHENIQPETQIKANVVIDHWKWKRTTVRKPRWFNSCTRQAKYTLSSNPGPRVVWTFIAESTKAQLISFKCISVSSVSPVVVSG